MLIVIVGALAGFFAFRATSSTPPKASVVTVTVNNFCRYVPRIQTLTITSPAATPGVHLPIVGTVSVHGESAAQRVARTVCGFPWIPASLGGTWSQELGVLYHLNFGYSTRSSHDKALTHKSFTLLMNPGASSMGERSPGTSITCSSLQRARVTCGCRSGGCRSPRKGRQKPTSATFLRGHYPTRSALASTPSLAEFAASCAIHH